MKPRFKKRSLRSKIPAHQTVGVLHEPLFVCNPAFRLLRAGPAKAGTTNSGFVVPMWETRFVEVFRAPSHGARTACPREPNPTNARTSRPRSNQLRFVVPMRGPPAL